MATKTRYRTIRERDVERYFVNRINDLGGIVFKFGHLDRLVFLPGGRIYLVEFKHPQEHSLSERQKWIVPRIEALGTPVYVINTMEAVDLHFPLLGGRREWNPIDGIPGA